ncbi:MAG TPA: hypothetical protein VGM74_18960 [Burkholderiaceae bacterium]|jgi:hypothetical protein
MTHEQLNGKYTRLRAELAAAYAEPEWRPGRSGRLDRIATDLVTIERTLAAQRPAARLIGVEAARAI